MSVSCSQWWNWLSHWDLVSKKTTTETCWTPWLKTESRAPHDSREMLSQTLLEWWLSCWITYSAELWRYSQKQVIPAWNVFNQQHNQKKLSLEHMGHNKWRQRKGHRGFSYWCRRLAQMKFVKVHLVPHTTVGLNWAGFNVSTNTV